MTRSFKVLSLILALLLALASSPAGLAEQMPEELPEFELTDMTEPAVAAPEPEQAPGDQAPDTPLPVEEPAAPSEESTPADAAPGDIAPEDAGESAGPIRMNADSLKLGRKETFALKPVLPEGAGDVSFRYASSKKSVARVSSAGVITAREKGTATITIKASTGEEFSCRVTVVNAPKKITLSAASVSLGFEASTGLGSSCRLGVSFPKGSGCQVRFSGYDEGIVSVADDGTVTARAPGVTTVKVSTYNKLKASCRVTVVDAPDAIAYADPVCAMIAREKRIPALVASPEGAVAAARFESDNPGAAAVNTETGEITGIGLGEATITATSFNGRTASLRVSVLPGPDRISLPEGTILLGKGERLLLDAKPVRDDGSAVVTGLGYKSSKAGYVAVAPDGTLTGRKKGSARVTVSAANGVKATCTVKVVDAPKSVRLSVSRHILLFDALRRKDRQASLKVALPGGSASAIAYSGFDPAVISVSAKGVVKAVGPGITAVTATTFNGKTARCRITVRAAADAANPNVMNVAHRGGKGYWPENTLTAFSHTASTGADAVELDARSTKDGVQVIHHDATFAVGGKKYTIRKLTFQQLRELDDSICTLDEALDVLAGEALEISLELKDTANPAACVRAVRSRGLQNRTVFISFDRTLLKQVRQLDGSAQLGFIINQTPGNLLSVLSGLKAGYVFQKKDALTAKNLYAWQDAGYRVGVWTVNEAAEIEDWLSMGVDYITSDYPRLVAEILDRRSPDRP